jgi:4a-hydroxytetrahydrobiopterin dehydratase
MSHWYSTGHDSGQEVMGELAEKVCVPCRGGVPALSEAEAGDLLANVPEWRLMDGVKRIERTFRFPSFAEALAFVNRIGEIAETEGHHPDITFGWGYATVSLFTHKIKGLHENDFIVAAKIDRLPAD